MSTKIEQIKVELIEHIKNTAKEKNMSQRDLSKATNLQHARVSNLLDGKKYMFTIDELLKITEALGFSIEITVSEKE